MASKPDPTASLALLLSLLASLCCPFFITFSFLLPCLQEESNWESMPADKDSDTGLSVWKTKARKWSTGTRWRSKEPPAVTKQTRLHRRHTHLPTCAHMDTHINTRIQKHTPTQWLTCDQAKQPDQRINCAITNVENEIRPLTAVISGPSINIWYPY